MILAIDLGTKAGFAQLKDCGNVNSFWVDFGKKARCKGEKYDNYIQFLNGFKDAKIIAYERVYMHAGTDAAHVYGFFQGILERFCFLNNIKLIELSVSTIKKFITGKGNAKKEEVITAVNKLGYNIKNDNEADAVAILHCVLDMIKNGGEAVK